MPDAFKQNIQSAFIFDANGQKRLYLLCGTQYVRYTDMTFSQMDTGYPRNITAGEQYEGTWFRGLVQMVDDYYEGIHAIYIDQFNNHARINVFYHTNTYFEYFIQYAYQTSGSAYRWSSAQRIDTLNLSPFTWIDAAFFGTDQNYYYFSNQQVASRTTASGALTTPVAINQKWGVVVNQFAGLNRVDSAYAAPNNKVYLFCDTQYIRYSSAIQPGTDSFYVDEGYPKTMANNWAAEGVAIVLPNKFLTQGFALFTNSQQLPVLFTPGAYLVSGQSQQPLLERWGKVANRFADLNRVDAAYQAENGKVYLFCDTQFIRYSGALNPGNDNFFADEGYPKTIANTWQAEGCPLAMPSVFKPEGYAVMNAGNTSWLFTETQYCSAQDPSTHAINSHWGLVRNHIQELNQVDTGLVWQQGSTAYTYLFSGDQYIRYSGGYDQYVDEGYPKLIANNWQQETGIALQGQFLSLVDAAFQGLDQKTYFFSNDQFVSNDQPALLKPINQSWGLVSNQIQKNPGVDAAYTNPAGITYLFRGDQYYRYSHSLDFSQGAFYADEGYPQPISQFGVQENSFALPVVFHNGIDAIFTDDQDRVVFLVDDWYMRSDQPDQVKALDQKWGLIFNRFAEANKIDAAMLAPDGAVYLFCQDQYLRYENLDQLGKDHFYAAEGYPKLIANNLGKQWPAEFQKDLAAAFTLEGRAYLFQNGNYLCFSDPLLQVPDKVDGDAKSTAIKNKWIDKPILLLNDVVTLDQFRQLTNTYNADEYSLLDYFQESTPTLEHLSKATGWVAEQVDALRPITGNTDTSSIQTLMDVMTCMDYCAKIGASPTTLLDVWGKIYNTTPDYAAASTVLVGLLRAKNSAKDWDGLSQELHNKMNLACRDALAPYLIYLWDLGNSRDLYEKLLIDVDMGDCALTSRIREAIDSVQLFYHRTLTNLETDGWDENQAQQLENLKKWWYWMKTYRVWEANRKVFLYPENYIRPELRSDKSPAFKKLEDELLQNDITDAAVETAYKNYLDEYSTVSSLIIAGGYVYQKTGDTYVIMFGFARTSPLKYYYRIGQVSQAPADPIDWEPWQEISMQINAERVYPVYAFNRMFVFWVELKDNNETEFSVGTPVSSKNTQIKSEPVIKYSFYNLNKEWVSPQTLMEVVGQLPPALASMSWTKDDLTNAGFYVTNPSLSSEYDSKEYIYLVYEFNGLNDNQTATATVSGQLTSELIFEPLADTSMVASLDTRPAFPDFGFTPRSFIQWATHFKDTISASWYSFDAKGGNFLCKPNQLSKTTADHIIPLDSEGSVFKYASGKYIPKVDAGFMGNDGFYLFSGSNYYVVTQTDGIMKVSEPRLIAERWGVKVKWLAISPAERLKQIFALNGIVHLFSNMFYFKYSAAPYAYYDEFKLKDAFTLDLSEFNKMANIGEFIAENGDDLDNAFVFDRNVYLFSQKQYCQLTVDELIINIAHSPQTDYLNNINAVWVKDNVLYIVGTNLGGIQMFSTFENKTWKKLQPLSEGTIIWGAEIENINAAFYSPDGNLYFFQDDKYTDPADNYRLKIIADRWCIQSLFDKDIQAVVLDSLGKLYFFKEKSYLMFENQETTTTNMSTPLSVSGTMKSNWGLPLTQQITAAFQYEGHLYILTQDQYVRYPGAYPVPNNPGYPCKFKGSWGNLPTYYNTGINTGLKINEDYYLFSKDQEKSSYVKYTYVADDNKDQDKSEWPYEIRDVRYFIQRLTSNTSQKLNQKLFAQGVPGLLSLDTQQTDELPRFVYYDGPKPVMADSTLDSIFYQSTHIQQVPQSDHLEFDSANGNYYWEIFFHTPFLIAQTLNTAQKFDVAQKWYQYIYDPTAPWEISGKIEMDSVFAAFIANHPEIYRYDQPTRKLSIHVPLSQDQLNELKTAISRTQTDPVLIAWFLERAGLYPYWGFLPFNETTPDASYETQLDKYRDDPFDPHAIAHLRPVAYRKTIVMNYIDNLMDWGDMLFRQYTGETINEARMLYVLAYDLLGKRPENLGVKKLTATETYAQIYSDLYPEKWNPMMVELENHPANAVIPNGTNAGNTETIHDEFVARGYFFIPENDQFIGYWDLVEDRLYKIRHCLNIEGIKQSLALFEPPINPMALVQAAAGGGLGGALADFNVAVPHYRFNFMLAKARELAGHIIQLGSSLLSALEKKDAEDLSLLRNTQENAILKLTLDIKNDQLDNATASLVALNVSLNNAKARQSHYEGLLSEGLSPLEKNQIAMMILSRVFSSVGQVMDIVSSVGSYIPNLGSPFAITYGGIQIGSAMKSIGSAMSAQASMFDFASNLSSLLGGWERRAEEWGLQHQLATLDVIQITEQIAGSQIQVKIAQKEINVQKKQIKHNEDIDRFLTNKFTNKQLYQWMAGKLAAVYFQTYQMALDLAKCAQRAFQFELGLKESEINFITPVYWDSLHKGLLSGEQLQLDLDRMEKAWLEKNQRRFEISKTISLVELDARALMDLKQKKVCEFNLNESLFDYDFPGHYCRQIKTISLTFPAIVGQYQNFNATLTQLSHRTLIEPDKAGLGYLLNPAKDQSMPLSIRADWRANQQIALSRGENDCGLFQMNFQDERYLPFEGTGAVSSWRLELSGYDGAMDLSKLNDVIITLSYTALQGGESFANETKSKLPATEQSRLFILKQEFTDQWNQFMQDPAAGMAFTVTQDMLTDMKGAKVAIEGIYMQYDLTQAGASVLQNSAMRLTSQGQVVTLKTAKYTETTAINIGKEWKLVPANSADAGKFTPDNLRNLALVVVYTAKAKF